MSTVSTPTLSASALRIYKQIITILQYAVNFYGFSHITAKRRPCERALVWLEETNHISCLHPTSEACRREDGTQMWIRHACHPSRRLATSISPPRKTAKYPSHRLAKWTNICQHFLTFNLYTQPSPRHHFRSHEVDTDFSQTSNLCTRSGHRIFTLSSILLTRERRHQSCPHEVDTLWSHFHQCY